MLVGVRIEALSTGVCLLARSTSVPIASYNPRMVTSERIAEDRLGRYVLGYLYVYFWVKRANARAIIEKGAIGILAVFLLLLAIELALELFWHVVFRGTSIALQILFFVAFSVALYNKISEWRERRQEFLYINAASYIAEILSDTREHIAEEETIKRLLAIFLKTFEPKHSTNATMALFDAPVPDPQDGMRLKVVYRHPSDNRSSETVFTAGEGAAGYCAKCRCAAYIPRKRFRHAVVVATQDGKPSYAVASDLYLSRPDEGAYESILCVPVVIYNKCYGALCFDSAKANAFRRLDIALASFYGSVMAQVLHARQGRADIG